MIFLNQGIGFSDHNKFRQKGVYLLMKAFMHRMQTEGICVCVLLLLILTLLSGTAIPAAEAASEGEFVISAAGELKQYKGSDTDVVIPSEVRVIDSSAFSGKQRLSSVVIPEGVTEIRGNAF